MSDPHAQASTSSIAAVSVDAFEEESRLKNIIVHMRNVEPIVVSNSVKNQTASKMAAINKLVTETGMQYFTEDMMDIPPSPFENAIKTMRKSEWFQSKDSLETAIEDIKMNYVELKNYLDQKL